MEMNVENLNWPFNPPGLISNRTLSTSFLYLPIDLVQPVLDGSFHVLLPVGERERDAVSSRDDGNHFTICTLPNKGIQRNHLQDTEQRGG